MEITVTRKYRAEFPFADSFLLGVIVVSIWTKTISARNRNTNKSSAIPERIVVNSCDAARYSYACKSGASGERIITNSCDAARYSYACKSAATVERTIPNACHAVRNRHALQSAASAERPIANACHAVWDYKICDKLSVKIKVVSI